MKVTTADFLVLNLPGIDLFIEAVDFMVANSELTYEQAVKEAQRQLREYAVSRDAFDHRPTVAVLAEPVTASLGDLLHRRAGTRREYAGVRLNVVYVIRDGDLVLYVGSTRYDARTRIKSHQKAHSPLGAALRSDANARSWSVEMIPHSDYPAAAAKEKELIAQFSPRFCRRAF